MHYTWTNMQFDIGKAIEILSRTPDTIDAMVSGLSNAWILATEGEGTWSAFDIVGHLIHGEKTDWIVRMEIILNDKEQKTFEPFDRYAQFQSSKGKTLQELLDEFRRLRDQNLATLKSKNLQPHDLLKTGIHPAFGMVTLSQLLATWVVHDLNHITQIARVMANQYKAEVGPWVEYLKVLNID